MNDNLYFRNTASPVPAAAGSVRDLVDLPIPTYDLSPTPAPLAVARKVVNTPAASVRDLPTPPAPSPATRRKLPVDDARDPL